MFFEKQRIGPQKDEKNNFIVLYSGFRYLLKILLSLSAQMNVRLVGKMQILFK